MGLPVLQYCSVVRDGQTVTPYGDLIEDESELSTRRRTSSLCNVRHHGDESLVLQREESLTPDITRHLSLTSTGHIT